MFRKEEAAVTDWSQETVEMCARRQAEILSSAAALIRPGGHLVYSTCTIDPAENQQQIAAFLARHPEFTVVEPAAALPAGMTAGEHGALSVPTRTGMDGFFLCAMQKNGEKLQ